MKYIFFEFFPPLCHPLFAVMSKGTDAYPRARQGSLGSPVEGGLPRGGSPRGAGCRPPR